MTLKVTNSTTITLPLSPIEGVLPSVIFVTVTGVGITSSVGGIKTTGEDGVKHYVDYRPHETSINEKKQSN